MKIYNENCIDGMKRLDTDSVDLIVTDPPYGMSFMGKQWDKALPPKEAFEQMVRVLKPGAFAFVMCAPRSDLQARMSILLEDAGFNIAFTPIYWTYATGFPKAKNFKDGTYAGFQPKPAVEVVIVAMKPLSEKNYSLQKEANGHGITYLDNCRIPSTDVVSGGAISAKKEVYGKRQEYQPGPHKINTEGRFPANLLVSDDSLNDGIERKTGNVGSYSRDKYNNHEYAQNHSKNNTSIHKGDSGSYSRYFNLDAWFAIIPKPSKKEKGEGNTHPTVKPIKLMSYLITLGSTEGHVVLDPFMGSGTTMIAAQMLKRIGIGYEMEEEYFNIAEARINGTRKTRSVRPYQEG